MKRLPRYRLCFVCGRDNSAGVDLQFYREGDRVVCEWTPEEKHLGYRDRAHGGVVASVLDEAMGWAPTGVLKRLCYTIEISVKYRLPVPSGERVRIEAECVGSPGRIARAAARLIDSRGAICVEATGVYFPLPAGKTEEILPHLYLEGEARGVTPEDL
ncbi:MAG TPA: PaaI family thioesterase [Candidatus Methylomirabilis sp.]|nr:PaaI family thioesterase [Candidatus Methylomirabilis sp.]